MRNVCIQSRGASLLALLLASAAPCAVLANPSGGSVSAGTASIDSVGSSVTIKQTTDKAIIDWRGFDIAAGESTTFQQPSSSSVTLNRVNSASASVINGNLTANGNLVIVNQNGVLFGKNSVVNVNGLIATTADIDNDTFMSNRLVAFDKPGNPDASIVNEGTITAKQAGLVGLVAPKVLNSGVITAKLGRIHLASGDTATVDLYGDGLMEVKASAKLKSQLVENRGLLNAEGGTIALTAAAAQETVNSLIQVSGTLNATSVGTKNGNIYIYAEGSNAVQSNVTANKGLKSGNGVVRVDGAINASSAAGRGGSVRVLGDNITLSKTAIINANGQLGGGTVNIGGQKQGSGATPTALTTLIEKGAFISANATQTGDGGEVIVWSDQYTDFSGSIEAKGGAVSGSGGFVETSSHETLLAFGSVNASSPNGSGGEWLLDPADITITSSTTINNATTTPYAATGTGSAVSAANIKTNLDAGTDVTITTSNDGYAGNGDIVVSNAILTTGTGALTLSAYRDINVVSSITLNGGALTLRSNNSDVGAGAINIGANITTNGGNIIIGGGSGVISAGSGYAVGDAQYTNGVRIASTINSGSGSIVINGQGYGTAGASNSNGIGLEGSHIETTSGLITLSGIGGGGSGYNNGIQIGSDIISSTGNININGTGGTGGTNFGIWVLSSSNIESTGTGESAGNITLSGAGPYAGIGINVGNITSVDGDITISGTGTSYSNGIVLYHTTNNILSTGDGSITINATGTGTSDLRIGGTNSYEQTNTIGGTNATGNITINANRISLNAMSTYAMSLNIQTAGTLTINGKINNYVSGAWTKVNASAGTFNFSGYDWGSLIPLTSVSLTSINALTLPSISAGSIFAQTTGDTSDITLASSKALTASGTGNALTLKAGESIILNSSDTLTTSGGNVILWSNANNKSAGNIQMTSTQITSNGGNVYLAGGLDDGANGGTASDGIPDNYAWGYGTTGNNIYGVRIHTGSSISSGAGNLTVLGSGSISSSSVPYGITTIGALQSTNGNIVLTGVGGSSSSNNFIFGLNLWGTITTSSGAINLTGTGGANSSGLNHGIATFGAQITSTGIGTVGAISLNGFGGAGGTNNNGLVLESGTIISSVDADINLTGTGYTSSTGLEFYHGNSVFSSGHGAIILQGTGGGSDILFDSFAGYYDTIGSSSETGDITLIMDDYGGFSVGLGSIQTQGTLTIKPRTVGKTVQVGSLGSGTLGLANNLLSELIANSYIFGSTSSGTITVNTTKDFGAANVSFISGVDINLAGSLTKATGAGAVNYIFDAAGDIYNSNSAGISATSGSINLTLQSDYDDSGAGAVYLSGGSILTNGGNVTIGGGSGTITAGSGYAKGDAAYSKGVTVSGTVVRTDVGNILINGQGGGSSATYLYGIYNAGTLQTTSGNITLNGLGGTGTSIGNMGIYAGVISSVNGAISLTGTGGNATSGTNFGLWLCGGQISSTGTGSSASTIALAGTGGTGGSGNSGIGINGSAIVSSIDGSISLSGNGGAGNSVGINFYSAGGGITSTGSSSIVLNAVHGGTSGDLSFGATSGTTTLGGSSASGNITINEDTISIGTATLNIQTSGTITMRPRTAGTTVGLGSGSGSLALSDAILSSLSANSYIFGSTSAGTVTVNTTKDFGAANVSLVSGGNINLARTLVKATGAGAADYNFDAAGDIYNSSSAGISATSGSINLTLQSDYDDSGVGAVYLSGGSILTNGGNVTIGGGSGTITAGSGYAKGSSTYTNGVSISSSINSGEGNIIINGQGYNVAGTYSAGTNGIYHRGGTIQTSSGLIALDGAGGLNTTGLSNLGIFAYSTISSSTGNINITGAGGTGGVNYGIWVYSTIDGKIESTGSGSGAATITLNGTGGGGGSGVAFNLGTVLSRDGAVVINGMGGTGNSYGINFYNNDSSISSIGAASITLNATGGGTGTDLRFGGSSGQIFTIGGESASGNITFNANHSNKIRISEVGSTLTALEVQTSGTVLINGQIDSGAANTINEIDILAGNIVFNGAWGSLIPLTTVSLTSTNALSLPSIRVNAAGSLLVRTTGATADLTIPSGSTLTAPGTGTPITLVAGRNFVNASTTPFSMTGGGHWLIYSNNPASNTLNGLTGDFNRYTCAYGGSCPSFPSTGNGLMYSYTPVLTVTPTAMSDLVYGSAAPSLAGYSYSLSGYLGSDSGSDVISGSLTGSTTYAQGSDVGSYAINYASGALASALGYGFSYSSNASAITVIAKTLIPSLINTVSKVYDGTTAATLDPATNYSLSGIYDSDDVSVSNTSGTYATKNVGMGLTVSVSGLSLTGAKAGNYTLASTSILGAVGAISQAPLTVVVDNRTIFVGTPNLVFTGRNNLVLQDVPLVTWSYTPVGYEGLPGTYTLEASAIDPQNRLANYTLTSIDGTLTVNPLPSTVVANIGTLGSIDDISAPVLSDEENTEYGYSISGKGEADDASNRTDTLDIEISPALQKLLRSAWRGR